MASSHSGSQLGQVGKQVCLSQAAQLHELLDAAPAAPCFPSELTCAGCPLRLVLERNDDRHSSPVHPLEAFPAQCLLSGLSQLAEGGGTSLGPQHCGCAAGDGVTQVASWPQGPEPSVHLCGEAGLGPGVGRTVRGFRIWVPEQTALILLPSPITYHPFLRSILIPR